MAFNTNSSEPFGSYYQDELISATSAKRPRAPYEFLAVGLLLLIALLALRIFGPSSWDLNVPLGVIFWMASLVSFLLPFAFYSEVNLARQLNPDYRTNGQSAKSAVFFFVLFGFATSLVHMFFVSSLLARILNVA